MASVSFGNNMKMSALASDRDRIQKFYRDVLGCEVTARQDVDFIRFKNDFYIGVVYEKVPLRDADLLKAVWLEVRTARPQEMKKKILDFGIKELEHWDKERFYFQAPGGQVFRLAGDDMPNGWGLND
jgi:catechol 2,3-dioxygenase-like lactoylglutathione lyase family enzyme